MAGRASRHHLLAHLHGSQAQREAGPDGRLPALSRHALRKRRHGLGGARKHDRSLEAEGSEARHAAGHPMSRLPLDPSPGRSDVREPGPDGAKAGEVPAFARAYGPAFPITDLARDLADSARHGGRPHGQGEPRPAAGAVLSVPCPAFHKPSGHGRRPHSDWRA